MSRNTTRIPVFPLALVLLPNAPLPLHIFEERYREMVAHCLDTESDFGVVQQCSSRIMPVGCTASIQAVLRSYDDGRSDILTVGLRRFRIEHMHEDHSYLEADVTFIEDQPVKRPDQVERKRQQLAESLNKLAELEETPIGEEVIVSLDPAELSFVVAGLEIFNREERQKLLEEQSVEKRLDLLNSHLTETLTQRQQLDAVRKLLGKKADIRSLLN